MYVPQPSSGGAEQSIIPMLAILVAGSAFLICVLSIPHVRHALAQRFASARSRVTPAPATDQELAAESAPPVDREGDAFDMSIFDINRGESSDP